MSSNGFGPVSIDSSPEWAVFGRHPDMGVGIIGWFQNELAAHRSLREWNSVPGSRLRVIRVEDIDTFCDESHDFLMDILVDEAVKNDLIDYDWIDPNELDSMGYPNVQAEDAEVISLNNFRKD